MTPPWIKTWRTVPLKLQIRSRYGIRQLIRQGDGDIKFDAGRTSRTARRAVRRSRLTAERQGASNHWRLSVVVEDNQGSASLQ
ncbi:hypothetical protein ACNKHU_07395 [Shigella flexneri]